MECRQTKSHRGSLLCLVFALINEQQQWLRARNLKAFVRQKLGLEISTKQTVIWCRKEKHTPPFPPISLLSSPQKPQIQNAPLPQITKINSNNGQTPTVKTTSIGIPPPKPPAVSVAVKTEKEAFNPGKREEH